jgi:hypothetical protein
VAAAYLSISNSLFNHGNNMLSAGAIILSKLSKELAAWLQYCCLRSGADSADLSSQQACEMLYRTIQLTIVLFAELQAAR